MTLYERLCTARERVCRINVRFMGDPETADEFAERVDPIIERVRVGTASRSELADLCSMGIVHEANLFGADIKQILTDMQNQMKAEIQY